MVNRRAVAIVMLCAAVSALNVPAGAVPRTQEAAVNALFLPFGTVTAEYERVAFSPATSLGVSGWYEYRDIRAQWLYAKLMHYPGGTALEGFGYGLTAGAIRSFRDKNRQDQLEEDTSPTLGAMAQYNWWFGRKKNILLGAGAGARAALKSIESNSPLRAVDGDVRLVIGLSF